MKQQDSSVASTNLINSAVAEGGAYETIRKRLESQGNTLFAKVANLNEARLEEFGSAELAVQARVRVRTENNCTARDIVQVGQYLLFGYNVFIGLKKETRVKDVFALYSLTETAGNYEIIPASIDNSFLTQKTFVSDFEELYRYYKHTQLIQLTIKDSKLLAAFKIGERMEDIRVFRWSISNDSSSITYIDNRGERDIQPPPCYDFEWTESSREDTVHGRHAHVNILDTLFIDTLGGNLTIKIENNTESGLGIYQETVEDRTQSLDDAKIAYASVNDLILLRVRPYREKDYRYFIFNTLTQDVLRVDTIGQSCVQLPEDHGLIFPGGYYLQTGEYKTFDVKISGLEFKRSFRSPNGEDVLYIFYEPIEGLVGLFAYNLISKKLQNPIYAHGYALAENGQLIIFSAESEPTRIHPMQIWKTPYQSPEFASKTPSNQTFYGKIGNAEMVRGISDLNSICRMIEKQQVSLRLYEELSRTANSIFDNHYWIAEEQTQDIASTVADIAATSERVIDEFEKVQSIRQQSAKALAQAEQEQASLVQSVRPDNWQTAQEYVDALNHLRGQRGHLTTIRDYRYIATTRIDELDKELLELEESLSRQTVDFLSGESSLAPYLEKIRKIDTEVASASTNTILQPLIDTIENTASGLDLLSGLMSTLQIDDATLRTQIIDAISTVYSKLNQSRANANHKQKNLGSEEASAQFSAQFRLFSQSITNALGLASTPEKCDEQLSRLLVQLEEMESMFNRFEQFLADILQKREEVYESFENHKQQLLDEQQRKAQSVGDSASRILASIEKRSLKFTEAHQLNTYFASDPLVTKTRELIEQLRELNSAIKADDIESRFKSIKEQALRSLRDKSDIFEAGGNIIKLGPRHRFSVNTQELDLTILPREGLLYFHLTGTNFYQPVDIPELQAMKIYWDMSLESETPRVYRSEYLASLVIDAASKHQQGLNIKQLQQGLLDNDLLNDIVRKFAAPRYKEGYERGVHDHDATLLLREILPVMERADLLRFDPMSRALAQIFWANAQGLANKTTELHPHIATWQERAQSAAQMHSLFASSEALELLSDDIRKTLANFIKQHPIPTTEMDIHRAADYLVAELGRERIEFIGSKYARLLVDELKRSLDEDSWRHYQLTLKKMLDWPAKQWNLSSAWLQALVQEKELQNMAHYIPEAVALINTNKKLDRRPTEIDLELVIGGLLGDHPTMDNRRLRFSLDSYLQRMEQHRLNIVPAYHRYLQLRQQTIASYRQTLRLEEFKARPLSTFVRNRLINESYLPLIGDNLAKQIGTVGENKRTDLMGLLMMISPPGYGKTTLMEYVANRLGLIFMKINCPSLGHEVLSLDPGQAPNATSRQELQKLNLALEMGNNVMLYLDDIQHTHPEFLQKFISLCDGTRRIEGVWEGRTKTYDMRGRKFCVVMAGNPYTESGEIFKIPDMLANRADIYNLGDIIGGMDEQFALSYIENALTSNPVLAPLATREMEDIYTLIDMARGGNSANTDLKHSYSGAEINEITEILKKMFIVQEVILKINQQYIASAAQSDRYRTEPPFKLQGSYRNMNKMTEKISAVMNHQELTQMINDHYLGEAQLLTHGAEDNLLKLAEIRNNMTEVQQKRWQDIRKDFLRNKAMGGDDAEAGEKVVAQLADLVSSIQSVSDFLTNTVTPAEKDKDQNASTLIAVIERLPEVIKSTIASINVINEPVPGIDKILTVLAETIEHCIFPLVHSMDKKLDIDLRTHEKMKEIS
ncbi:MAG: DNA repair ATPase, partial [Parahaliea sp.]